MGDNAQASDNRARMPRVAALVAGVRKSFPGARVQWAREGGIEVGRKSPDDGKGGAACGGSPKLEKFMAVLRKEFLRKFGRVARAGDAEWGIYLSEHGALRWDDFCGRTFDE